MATDCWIKMRAQLKIFRWRTMIKTRQHKYFLQSWILTFRCNVQHCIRFLSPQKADSHVNAAVHHIWGKHTAICIHVSQSTWKSRHWWERNRLFIHSQAFLPIPIEPGIASLPTTLLLFLLAALIWILNFFGKAYLFLSSNLCSIKISFTHIFLCFSLTLCLLASYLSLYFDWSIP